MRQFFEMARRKREEKKGGAKMKQTLIMAICLVIMCGCILGRRETVVLRESQQYCFIPKDTPFKARLEKDGMLMDVTLSYDAYAVSAGYLFDLQKAANREALGIPD